MLKPVRMIAPTAHRDARNGFNKAESPLEHERRIAWMISKTLPGSDQSRHSDGALLRALDLPPAEDAQRDEERNDQPRQQDQRRRHELLQAVALQHVAAQRVDGRSEGQGA